MSNIEQIDLSRSPPFRLGPLTVEPALRQITAATSETIEPRVMQVLVMLAMANGAIVSRDEIVQHCWGGRIVGDDSINRVIARLRKLVEEHGQNAVRIETITKVGYRLVGPVVLTAAIPRPQLATEAPPAPPPKRSSRPLAIVSAAAMLALVIVGFALRADLPFGAPARPEVVIDTFAMPPAAGIANVPPGFAVGLRDEMLANFGSASRIAPRLGSGISEPAAYRLTGRVESGTDQIRIFANLIPPGSDQIIWSQRFEKPSADSGLALREFGLDLALIVRCIATASYGSAAPTTTLPLAALKPWARYCADSLSDDVSIARLADSLRMVVADAPSFSQGWSRLAAVLISMSYAPGISGAAALRAEGAIAVDTALRLDPKNADGWLAKSFLVPEFNFLEQERLLLKGVAANPTDCGCEYDQLGKRLLHVGRPRAALAAFERVVDMDPVDWGGQLLRARAMIGAGEHGQVDKNLVALGKSWPRKPAIEGMRYQNAIAWRNWRLALQLSRSGPERPEREVTEFLVEALASGDRARIVEAGGRFQRFADGDGKFHPDTPIGLNIAGRPDAAVAAAARLIDHDGQRALGVLFDPAFAEARQTPAFATLVQRLRLIEYWRKSGRSPDFCAHPGAPRLCTDVKRPG